jgi:hypothetical protein
MQEAFAKSDELIDESGETEGNRRISFTEQGLAL